MSDGSRLSLPIIPNSLSTNDLRIDEQRARDREIPATARKMIVGGIVFGDTVPSTGVRVFAQAVVVDHEAILFHVLRT